MTHRSTAKLIKISNVLLTKTRQGRLTWVPTEKLDVFGVDFPDYSIRIAHRVVREIPDRVVREIPTGETVMDNYKVEIYNSEGRLVEAATSDEMKDELHEGINIAEVLKELYELARRQALGIDNALDDLLSRLSSA
ncbi:hypothetical protein [Candidatus Thiosymbion oneisti]|uniref:hypothetical protein n=1 Tax=Candidatus Thiosymbion oneisti TaxID=589554 RepID=UPI000B7D9C1F|nr:hypothetical protein [Candidatus Thiosymbion oneisti]